MIVSPLRCSLLCFSFSCFSSFLLFLSQTCCSLFILSSPTCLLAHYLFLLVFSFSFCFLSVSALFFSSTRMSALLLYCTRIRKLLLCRWLFLHNSPSASPSCIFSLLFRDCSTQFHSPSCCSFTLFSDGPVT